MWWATGRLPSGPQSQLPVLAGHHSELCGAPQNSLASSWGPRPSHVPHLPCPSWPDRLSSPPSWHYPLCSGSHTVPPLLGLPSPTPPFWGSSGHLHGDGPLPHRQEPLTLVSCLQRHSPAPDLWPVCRAVTPWHRHSAAASRAAGPGFTSRSTKSCECAQVPRTSTGEPQSGWGGAGAGSRLLALEALASQAHAGQRASQWPGWACSHPIWEE